jgi:hypothetical protein
LLLVQDLGAAQTRRGTSSPGPSYFFFFTRRVEAKKKERAQGTRFQPEFEAAHYCLLVLRQARALLTHAPN